MYGMKYASTITSKGTITLPAELRAELGLKPGERVGIELDPKTGQIIVKKSPTLIEVRAMNQRLMKQHGIKPGVDAHEAFANEVAKEYAAD
jgi:AbrB family looped-hinge helix DNA binding protein